MTTALEKPRIDALALWPGAGSSADHPSLRAIQDVSGGGQFVADECTRRSSTRLSTSGRSSGRSADSSDHQRRRRTARAARTSSSAAPQARHEVALDRGDVLINDQGDDGNGEKILVDDEALTRLDEGFACAVTRCSG